MRTSRSLLGSKPPSTRITPYPTRAAGPGRLARTCPKSSGRRAGRQGGKLPVAGDRSPNSGIRATTVIGATLPGRLRSTTRTSSGRERPPSCSTRFRALSMIGTWLRAFDSAAVRMLDAVSHGVLPLRGRTIWARSGMADLTIDLDSRSVRSTASPSRARRSATPSVRLPPAAGHPPGGNR